MKPRLLGAGLALTFGVGLVVACVPHPGKEYEEFLDATASYRGKKPVEDDSGPVDAQAPTQAIEGLYFGSCLSALSLGDINKVLRFYTEVRFVPGTDGGKLDIQFTPLRGADLTKSPPEPKPPASVSKSEAFGNPFGVKESPVKPNGRFTVQFATVGIDPNANPISGRPIKIENVIFDGIFSATAGPSVPVTDSGAPDDAGGTDGGAEAAAPVDSGTPTPGPGARPRFCATLAGYVVEPIRQPLTPDENFCVFVPVKEGDPVPDIKRDEYKCKLQ